VVDALNSALLNRQISPDLILHSDRGCQYASQEYRALLTSKGITQSMSRKGNCYDNAPQESFFGKFKSEWLPDHLYVTIKAARAAAFQYIEVFYNRKRSSSVLGYVSPETFEAAHAR